MFIDEDMVAQSILTRNLRLFEIDGESEDIESRGGIYSNKVWYGTVSYSLPQDMVTMCLMGKGCISC